MVGVSGQRMTSDVGDTPKCYHSNADRCRTVRNTVRRAVAEAKHHNYCTVVGGIAAAVGVAVAVVVAGPVTSLLAAGVELYRVAHKTVLRWPEV